MDSHVSFIHRYVRLDSWLLYRLVFSQIPFCIFFVLFSFTLKQNREITNILQDELWRNFSFSPITSSFFPSVFSLSPANFNTHHGILGIVQEMPLGRTFLSGTVFLCTLFILKYLSSALTWKHYRNDQDTIPAFVVQFALQRQRCYKRHNLLYCVSVCHHLLFPM